MTLLVNKLCIILYQHYSFSVEKVVKVQEAVKEKPKEEKPSEQKVDLDALKQMFSSKEPSVEQAPVEHAQPEV